MDNHNRKKKTVDDTVCEIHKFSGYAVLSNCFVRSTNLSWSAIGLLARVMDFPHEWNFSKAGLIAICPDGETAIDTALSELKEWGYLEIKTLMPNESSTGRIQPLYSFYEYSARDTSIPQYDYELETFMVENAVLNRVKKTDNYTMISSKLLRNKEIPNKLLGFLLKVLSLPDYWHFSMSGLKAICKEGKTAVHNAVNKLIDMGYLVRTQLLSNESIHNCFEYVYSFFDVPVSKEEADELDAETRRKAITICSPLPYTTLRGTSFPRSVIKSKMLQANIYMVESVLVKMAQVDNIKDFRRYFISSLYNEVLLSANAR